MISLRAQKEATGLQETSSSKVFFELICHIYISDLSCRLAPCSLRTRNAMAAEVLYGAVTGSDLAEQIKEDIFSVHLSD